MNTLSTKHKQALKAKAHSLKPIVMIGNNGFSESVKKEMDRALTDHELIKIRIACNDREERRALVLAITEAMHAQLVQALGNIAILYRKNTEEK